MHNIWRIELSMIKLESVNFGYKNNKDILQNINLEIKDGEFVSIIGKNGSRKIYFGKTYLRLGKTK